MAQPAPPLQFQTTGGTHATTTASGFAPPGFAPPPGPGPAPSIHSSPSTTTTLLTAALQHIGNRRKPYKSESQLFRSMTRLLGPKAYLAAALAEWIWQNYEVVLPMLQRGYEFVAIAVRMVISALKKRGVDVDGHLMRMRTGFENAGIDVDRHLDTFDKCRDGLRRSASEGGSRRRGRGGGVGRDGERTRGWVEELSDDASSTVSGSTSTSSSTTSSNTNTASGSENYYGFPAGSESGRPRRERRAADERRRR